MRRDVTRAYCPSLLFKEKPKKGKEEKKKRRNPFEKFRGQADPPQLIFYYYYDYCSGYATVFVLKRTACSRYFGKGPVTYVGPRNSALVANHALYVGHPLGRYAVRRPSSVWISFRPREMVEVAWHIESHSWSSIQLNRRPQRLVAFKSEKCPRNPGN